MLVKKEGKFIDLLLLFYFLGTLNFIYYKYSMSLNFLFILIEAFFMVALMKRKVILEKNIIIVFIFFIIHIFISWIASDYSNKIVLSVLQFSILNAFTVFILAHVSNDYTEKILDFFIRYAVILTIYSLVMKFIAPQLTSTNWGIKGNKVNFFGIDFVQLVYGMPGDYGYASITNNPNVFGFISAIAFGIYNSKYYSKVMLDKNKHKIIQILINIILITGIVLSNSRGALIITFIMLYVQIIIGSLFRRRMGILVFGMINIMIVVAVLLIILLRFDIMTNFINSISDLNGRTEIWNELKSMVVEGNVVLGAGFGAISKIIAADVILGANTSASYSAFNIYISTFVELGIIGVVLLITWIFYTIKICINNINLMCRKNINCVEKELVVLALIISVYIISLVENRIMNSSYFHLIWITLTIGIIKRNKLYRSLIVNER